MAVRAITNKGEFILGHSNLDYKIELEELKQNIITTLRSWKWDCFFDLEAGIDWKNYLGSYGKGEELKNNILKEIKKIDGVLSIEKYDNFINEKRQIIIQLTIKTIYGKIEINENNFII